MILSDIDIAEEIYSGRLGIDPYTGGQQLQPASVEVHLDFDWRLGDCREELTLEPEQFLLAHTVEKVRIPPHLVGHLHGKSSLGRLGLLVHSTAGLIDPGFEGQITLELKNLNPLPLHLGTYGTGSYGNVGVYPMSIPPRTITLQRGQAIGQLVFHVLSSPSQRPYGHPDLGSHYMGQLGTTPSHLAT